MNLVMVEAILESVPQIGLSFYIIHHHGWFDPVFPEFLSFEGDLQKLSLMGSILSINISMATRRAWWKLKGKPPKKMDIFYAYLWNFVPMNCFLIAYYIIMADSKWILMVYACISPIACVAYLIMLYCLKYFKETLSKKLTDWMESSRFSINKFLLTNTFIMACLHTIQIYAIGLEDPDLLLKPFNLCTYEATKVDKSPLEGKLNTVHKYENQNEFVLITWGAVVLTLVHILLENWFPTKREQSFFLYFILYPYLDECEPVNDDVYYDCTEVCCQCILNFKKETRTNNKSQAKGIRYDALNSGKITSQKCEVPSAGRFSDSKN